MHQLVVVIICLVIGLALQRSRRLPATTGLSLNLYVIYVALPALVLSEIAKIQADAEMLLPVVATWGVMTFSALITWLTARALRFSREVTGALMLIVPLGNTSFLGLPLIYALLGESAVPYAILYDQFGTCIALNTYGIIIAATYAGSERVGARQLARNILLFPPFIALIVALASYSFTYPDWLTDAIARIAVTLVPVVMVAVGLQWNLRLDPRYLKPFAIGLGYKLLLIPLVTFAVLWLLGFSGLPAKTVVLQAAMPAMISAGALAIAHNLAPKLASAIVGYGVLLSLFSVSAWSLLLPW